MADEMRKLISQIDESLDKTESEVSDKIANLPGSDKIYNSVKHIIDGLRKELTEGINPDRATNVVLIGQTNAGKTVLVTAMLQQTVSEVKRTEVYSWHNVGENLNILDVVGFQNNKQKENNKKLATALKQKCPDVVFVVLNATDYRKWDDYRKEFGEVLNTVMIACKKAKSTLPCFVTSKSVPVLWVVTHMDAPGDELSKFGWSRTKTEEVWKNLLDKKQKKIIAIVRSKLKEFNHFSDEDPVCITAVPEKEDRKFDYGIDILRTFVQISVPLNTQIQANNKKRYEAIRRTIAMKIISTYSSLCATVSLLPLADIPLTICLNNAMLITLEALRIDPNRTAQSFSVANGSVIAATYAVRSILLGTFFFLELTGIGIIVSIPAGAAVASTSTSFLGIKAYHYFTEDN